MTAYAQNEADLRRLVRSLLAGAELLLVDGGARNGPGDLRRLAPYVAAYGFEPSPAEFARLDAAETAYARMRYSPLALTAEGGPTVLYVNRRPGATSTLPPNEALLRHFARDHWSEMSEVVSEQEVEGITLAAFLERESIDSVDLLKLDTQGNELDILRSAGERLRTVAVVKTEVELIPLYRGQPLLGDVCSHLSSQGFEMVDLRWTDPCRRYHFSPHLPETSYRLLWGDAIFVRAPYDFDEPRALHKALVLAELGYTDLALYQLERVPSLGEDARRGLLAFYQLPPAASPSGLVRAVKRHVPPRVWEAARVLRHPPRRAPKEVASVPRP